MAAPKTKSLTEQEQLRRTVAKLDLRGCTQVDIAGRLGISQGRVSQILKESAEEWRARRVKETAADLIQRKLDQFRDTWDEAWRAWVQSKEDEVCNVQEKARRTIYRTIIVDGESVRLPHGERLKVVKQLTKVQERLPAIEYLKTIIDCLREEAKLEGLTEEAVVNITNNVQANGPNVVVSWDSLWERDEKLDPIEAEDPKRPKRIVRDAAESARQ